MTIIKLDPNILTPVEVLDRISKLKPKSVLVIWIDQTEDVHVEVDSNVKMKDICYYDSVLDIWKQTILTGTVK